MRQPVYNEPSKPNRQEVPSVPSLMLAVLLLSLGAAWPRPGAKASMRVRPTAPPLPHSIGRPSTLSGRAQRITSSISSPRLVPPTSLAPSRRPMGRDKVIHEPTHVSKDTFDWSKQWYPMAVVDLLEASRPHAMQLLGRRVVVWNDAKGAKGGKWRCFMDECPHRRVPLSEGRVEDTGELLCAYHAWRFNGDGECTKIPQAPEHLEASHRAKSCASCVTFPTKVMDGLLWVWPETGPLAEAAAAAGPPPTLVEEGLSPKAVRPPWGFRDLPMSWDWFHENVVDVAHAVVAHHGILGDRNKDAVPMEMNFTRKVSTNGGFAMNVIFEKKISGPFEASSVPGTTTRGEFQPPSLEIDFRPPARTLIRSRFPSAHGEAQHILVLYATPSAPGICRHIGTQILIPNDKGQLPPGIGWFALPIPQWLMHVSASIFFHQDNLLLHGQQHALADRGYVAIHGESGEAAYAEHVYTPTSADKSVLAFRAWLAVRGGGGPPYNGRSMGRRRTDAELFDVMEAHVKDCRVCSDALHNFRTARFASFATAAALVAAGKVLSVEESFYAAALFGAMGFGLHWACGLFHSFPFRHWWS